MGIFGFSKNKKYKFKVVSGDDSLRTPKYELLEEEERFIQEFLHKCKMNGISLRKIKFKRIYIGLINIHHKDRFGKVAGFNFQENPAVVLYRINDERFSDGEMIQGDYDECIKAIDYIIEFIKEYVEK